LECWKEDVVGEQGDEEAVEVESFNLELLDLLSALCRRKTLTAALK